MTTPLDITRASVLRDMTEEKYIPEIDGWYCVYPTAAWHFKYTVFKKHVQTVLNELNAKKTGSQPFIIVDHPGQRHVRVTHDETVPSQ